jgi:pentatricopeptide repeat protein
MALALLSPSATPAAHRLALRPLTTLPLARITAATTAGLASSLGFCSLQRAGATGDSDGADSLETQGTEWLDADLLRMVSSAADADQALDIVAESGAPLEVPKCNAIIAAALDRGNVDLALSVFDAMRSGFTGGLVLAHCFDFWDIYLRKCDVGSFILSPESACCRVVNCSWRWEVGEAGCADLCLACAAVGGCPACF